MKKKINIQVVQTIKTIIGAGFPRPHITVFIIRILPDSNLNLHQTIVSYNHGNSNVDCKLYLFYVTYTRKGIICNFRLKMP